MSLATIVNSRILPPHVPIILNNRIVSRSISSAPPEPGTIGGIVAAIAEKLGIGELATGGLQLAVLGGALAGFRYFGGYIIEYLKKKTIVTADFDSRDESYSWILNWLNDQPYSKITSRFSVSTSILRAGQRLPGEGLDALTPPVYFLPSPGFHFFMYKNRLVWLNRHRPGSSSSGAAAAMNPNVILERIEISTFGQSRELIQSLVYEAQKKFMDRDKSRTVVFAADQYGAWRRTRSRPKRPLSTVVIPDHVKTTLVDDAQEFLVSEQWYSDRGIPYRRGYLLYGTPGSGKTSFVYSLAGELGLNIYVVNLSNKSLTDDTLGELVSDTPSRCILLIEDVDAAFIQREKGEGTTANNITFSGLLNAIDGVAAQEGRILCMTTNHLERLDQALIRPGRIDVRVHFGNATQRQAQELFKKFYPNLPQDSKLPELFASKVPQERFSMAHLQGFLMSHKQRPERAVELVDAWVEGHDKGISDHSTQAAPEDL
ncbi:P-loop containing nucleoside triphosphate hydrolase protein [Rhizopus microsporus ATCC 52813]|uniref:P-loop containing nucleoside triphosphate hydrolase protein n=1 Tax=Rhizopus microsporus ATCC 52813 TaxID=1340429 RepID=A0A2G4SHI7_RHIZD|nr:P-loop containing nucleoside triphosphate hydrolase protein [Rhizopus microsporus ATCC 52813]PHZ08219.1 P-loop containing nucleoside triphosphate hydrolase protein [Rhizopus microsporus ATCC 52813]